jgi:hypothetical protein
MDTLLTGVVPLLESMEQIKIAPEFVPWLDLVYFVDVSSEEKLCASLQGILAKRDQEYQEKLANITKYRDILDYTKGKQFDLYMTWFSEKLNISFGGTALCQDPEFDDPYHLTLSRAGWRACQSEISSPFSLLFSLFQHIYGCVASRGSQLSLFITF